ncbi:hypothetical protein GCM10020254_06760 [Streptomyces goshikiensis]
MWWARAAGPPLSSSKYSRENVMTVEAQTLPPDQQEGRGRVGLAPTVDEVVDEPDG